MTSGRRSTEEGPTVREIADKSFISLDENTLVAEAAKTLYERGGCSIVVTRNDPKTRLRVPVGIVTERDIIFRVVAQNKGPFKITLSRIMSSPVTVIDAGSPMIDALEIMKEKGFNRLPVVTKGGEMIGLVTMEMMMREVPLRRMRPADNNDDNNINNRDSNAA
ncbi:MAG TPA: CBS domain-containing protein [Nitrososphaera sp.]|jgi:CBS domain-containing protein